MSRSDEPPKPALKELALGRVLGSLDRGIVHQRCFGVAPQPSEQVGADRMEQVMRGRFDGLLSPATSLSLATTTPILLIHSKQDTWQKFEN